MKTKTTRRALITSLLALVLCVAMLAGTTFAWFTDSVTSAGNKIVSGTLDVDLVDAAGNSMAGEVIEFVAADGRTQDAIIWEPGCTYVTEPVYVVNKGNLALKYEMVINGIVGNAKLLEAIEWTVTVGGVETALADLKGELPAGQKSAAIVLSGYMKSDAGNEYQDLTVEGISITVVATQLAAEEDSFDNQYDAQAEYAAQTMLKDVAAVQAGESASVKLESDGYVVLDNTNNIGAKVAGDVTVDLNGKSLFVKVEDGNAHKSLFNIVKGGKLTVTGNGTIQMVSGANNLVTAIFNNTQGTLVIENGTYKMDYPNDWQVALIPTIVDNNGNAADVTTIINGGTFYHTRNMFRNFPSNNGITKLVINGGTFNGQADDWAAIWNQKASATTQEGQSLIEINGGVFNYVKVDNEFETGVTVASDVAMSVTSSDELKAAINAGSKKIVLAPGNYTAPANSDVSFVGSGKDTVIDLEGTIHNANISNATVTGNTEITVLPGESAVFNNVVFDAKLGGAASGQYGSASGDVTFIGCTFERVLHFDTTNNANILIEDCTFGTLGYLKFGKGSTNITVKNTTFMDTTSTSIWGEKGLTTYCPITFVNCEFNNRNVVTAPAGQSVTFTSCTMNGGTPVYYVDNNDGIIRGGNIPVVTIN